MEITTVGNEPSNIITIHNNLKSAFIAGDKTAIIEGIGLISQWLCDILPGIAKEYHPKIDDLVAYLDELIYRVHDSNLNVTGSKLGEEYRATMVEFRNSVIIPHASRILEKRRLEGCMIFSKVSKPGQC